MKDAFRHSRELLDFLNLPYTDNVKENDFPTLVTKIFAGKMTSQYDDPLLKQVLPSILEEKVNKDFTKEEVQRECFNYLNLRPLWATDNCSKSNKWEEPKNIESI